MSTQQIPIQLPEGAVPVIVIFAIPGKNNQGQVGVMMNDNFGNDVIEAGLSHAAEIIKSKASADPSETPKNNKKPPKLTDILGS